MKKILVPTDFSSCADNALDFAVQSAKILTTELVLLHVFDITGYIYPGSVGTDFEYEESLLDEAIDKLAELKNKIEKEEEITVSTLVYKGNVTVGILKTVDDLGSDFIIMGTVGASGLKEKLIGSETAAIIGKTRVPILVIPEQYKWKKPKEILLTINHFEEEPAFLDYIFEIAYLFSANINAIVFTNSDDEEVIIVDHSNDAFQYEKKIKERYKVEAFSLRELSGSGFENTLEEYIEQHNIDLLAMVTYKRSFFYRLFHPSISKRMSYHTKIPLLIFPRKESL
jgi:nucleotide-binding universal stress UspA family protein